MIGSNAMAMFRKDETYYMFDSHSRNRHGSIVSDGKSVLLTFSNIETLESYVRTSASQLCTKQNPIMECLPVTIHILHSEGTEFFTEYLSQQESMSHEKSHNVFTRTDQSSEEKTQNSLTKTEYNRIYKNKQRANTDFQMKEMQQKQQNRTNEE
jgi:hypothetical protein